MIRTIILATALLAAAGAANAATMKVSVSGKTEAAVRAEISQAVEAVCRDAGTLMAQWLFWQMKTTGALKTPAKFKATWKSPSLVAPSPAET